MREGESEEKEIKKKRKRERESKRIGRERSQAKRERMECNRRVCLVMRLRTGHMRSRRVTNANDKDAIFFLIIHKSKEPAALNCIISLYKSMT